MRSASTGETQASSTQPDLARTLFVEVCSSLLYCQKNLSLYPQEHPRVRGAVEGLRSAVQRYCERTRRPFRIDADLSAAKAKDLPRDCRRLQELLRANFMARLEIVASVTVEELTHLCCMLFANRAGHAEAEEEIASANARRLEGIEISYYCAQDFGLTPGAAGGPRRSPRATSLGRLLAGLSDDMRDSLRAAFLNSTLNERLSRVQRGLEGRLAAESAGDFDLVGEIFESILADRNEENGDVPSEAELVSMLESVLSFLESNLEILTGMVESYPDESDRMALRREIHEMIRLGLTLPESQLTNVQALKEQLSGIFRVSAGSSGADRAGGTVSPAGPEGNRPLPRRPETRSPGDAGSLHEAFRTIRYDDAELQAKLGRSDVHINFLQIVLYFLKEPHLVDGMRAQWEAILSRLKSLARSSTFRLKALPLLRAELEACAGSEVEDLLLRFLEPLEPSALQPELEALATIDNGLAVLARFLDRYEEEKPEATVQLLVLLSKSRTAELAELVDARFLRLARNPLMLADWVDTETEWFYDAANLERLLARLSVEEVREGFRRAFHRLGQSRVLTLLDRLAPGVAGAEQIVFVALDNRSHEIHIRGIANLSKYPTPVVISSLISILKENNHRDSPSIVEIEATLTAIAAIDDPQAQECLQRIPRQRRRLRLVYSRDIRKALQRVRKRQQQQKQREAQQRKQREEQERKAQQEAEQEQQEQEQQEQEQQEQEQQEQEQQEQEQQEQKERVAS